MRWNKYTLTTTTEAEDMISSMMMDVGIEGIEIEDRVPLSEQDRSRMFVDIFPEGPEDDGVARISFYLEPEEKVENGLDAREGTSDGQRRPDSVSGVFEETGVLDTVDHDCGKFFSCRHNLTYAVESGLDAADRLGGVSLA